MVTIIHPSRGRPHQSHATICKWIARAGLGVAVEVIASLDSNDIELDAYLDRYRGVGRGLTVLVSDNKSAIQAINNAMAVATGDLFIVVSDDTDCPNSWAVRLLAYTKGQRDFVMKTNDGIQNTMITMPIFDRAYFNRDGYVYNPEYDHLFADREYSDVAYKRKRVIRKMTLRFPHNHYSVTKQLPDEVHLKNERTYQPGKALYMKRKKMNFGLRLLLLLLMACTEEPVNEIGCRTAVDKVTNVRVFLRQETYAEFNTTNIRSSQWDTTDSLYYDYRWEKCNDL